ASQSRLKLTEGPLSANDWLEANEWLRVRAAQSELADLKAQKARVGTQRATAHVLHARTDLKKVEVLSARIGAEEQSEQERAERRLEDELTALRFAPDRREDK
ncbi:MAG TPA: flagellar FliJ family protein, partial [Polyangiaceae bacterium]